MIMASAKYSTKNRLGFKHKFATTTILSTIVAMFLVFLISEFLAPLLYPYYKASMDVGPGSVGSKAYKSLPYAHSIEEMKEYDKFTIQIQDEDWSWSYNDTYIDEKLFYTVPLPSGETIAVRINMDSVLNYKDQDTIILPVGTLRKLEGEKKCNNGAIAILSTTDYYVDMLGEFANLMTEQRFQERSMDTMGLLMLVFLCIIRIILVRKAIVAPALFSKRDPMIPRNDLELWAASTYAIWSNSFSILEGWPLMGGAHRGIFRRRMSRRSLEEQWDIKTAQDGLETVEELTQGHALDTACPQAAWDLCRATQLLGMMYQCKMIDRDTMDREYSKTGMIIQRIFSSWEELAKNYLAGYAGWQQRVADGSEAQKRIAARYQIYERLKSHRGGPYTIPWNIDLHWHPQDRGSNSVLKKTLKEYYPELY